MLDPHDVREASKSCVALASNPATWFTVVTVLTVVIEESDPDVTTVLVLTSPLACDTQTGLAIKRVRFFSDSPMFVTTAVVETVFVTCAVVGIGFDAP